jgi:hypothetical protein
MITGCINGVFHFPTNSTGCICPKWRSKLKKNSCRAFSGPFHPGTPDHHPKGLEACPLAILETAISLHKIEIIEGFQFLLVM